MDGLRDGSTHNRTPVVKRTASGVSFGSAREFGLLGQVLSVSCMVESFLR